MEPIKPLQATNVPLRELYDLNLGRFFVQQPPKTGKGSFKSRKKAGGLT